MEKRLFSVPLLASIVLIILVTSQLDIVVSAARSRPATRTRGTSLLIESTPNPSEPNQAIVISGRLVSGSQGLGYRNVRIDSSIDGRIWGVIAWTKTKRDGRFSLSWTAPQSTSLYIRAYFPGDKQYSSSFSNTILQQVVSSNNYRCKKGLSIHWEGYEHWTWQCQVAKDLGAEFLRTDFHWAHIQRDGADSWFWDWHDHVTQTADQYGLKIVAILDYSVWWISDDKYSVPEDKLPYWRNFVKTVVERYKSKVIGWEIWNEPNIWEFWHGTIEQFVLLHNAAYDVIKLADPDHPALLSLSQCDVPWLERFYTLGGRLDGVAVHPYCNNFDPDATSGEDKYSKAYPYYVFYAAVPRVYQCMIDHGDRDKHVWITEFGYETKNPKPPKLMTEEEKANYVIRAFEKAATEWSPWCEVFTYYCLTDFPFLPSEPNNSGYGLLYYDGSKKPSYDAFKALSG